MKFFVEIDLERGQRRCSVGARHAAQYSATGGCPCPHGYGRRHRHHVATTRVTESARPRRSCRTLGRLSQTPSEPLFFWTPSFLHTDELDE